MHQNNKYRLVTLTIIIRQIDIKINTMNSSEFKVKGEDLLRKIREIIDQGNVNRIIIKDDSGKVYLEIPVTVGVIGALIAPVLAAVGALAALAADFTIEVIRRD
jgi:phage-related minor tail protein